MAAAAAMIGLFIIFMSSVAGQHLGTTIPSGQSGICSSIHCNSVRSLQRLKDCVVIVGNLRLVLMEGTISSDFSNISFPNLREVTGFVVLYRIKGLESVGQLFPNLTRIRGGELINNYALVVHDMAQLREIGLYSLLKIDRGGVIIWGGPHTCYVNTVDWNAIAPRSRHMLTYPEMSAHCNMIKPCKCGANSSNYCWNSKRCQRFISQPGSGSCHPECLGCRHNANICSACRHYTYRGRCISQCPSETIVLPDNDYCVTVDECKALRGWVWNNTCVFDCPAGFEKFEYNNSITCQECHRRGSDITGCRKDCKSLAIHSLSGIQQADKCVNIIGSLIIHVSSLPGAVDELTKYLKLIEVVTDYVHIYSSVTLTSLNFLPNLRRISGNKLKDNTYSLIIHDMENLREIFTPKVMKDLQIDRGKLKVLNNPVLCMSKIYEIEEKFLIKSNDTEIPPGLNGYSGGCEDFGLHVEIINETAAAVLFSPKNDSNVHYTVLYAKVPPESRVNFVPELCSKSEWDTVHTNDGRVLLTSLHPATTYAVCIEAVAYSKIPLQSFLARSPILNFTMSFEKPEPPFILEIVASSPNTVDLRWVDHKDYRKHINSYQLDIILIDIPSRDVALRDHCNMDTHEYIFQEDYSRHVMVSQPPAEYKSCETDCVMLIPHPEKITLLEDHFDVCSSFKSECNLYEEPPPNNSSFENFVKTLALNISGTAKSFRVEGLAPFRDYKFRLRSCATNKCSRSTRAVIRTLRSNKADIPSITHSYIDESDEIFIKWDAPEETNGPIFMYLIQVSPYGSTDNETLPDLWCVYPEVRSFVVRSQVTKELQVRVCSSTLGSLSACSEWQRISIPEVGHNVLLLGIISSIILTLISIAIGYIYSRRMESSDIVPLVDMTSVYRYESDPPVTYNDFMPLYSVPLNEALLDC